MKISKINFKDKKGKMHSINMQKQDGSIYDIFFIYGAYGCGKTFLCKLISDAWQMNMFHGENNNYKISKNTNIEIEAFFNDLSPINFGIPSNLGNKNLIKNKVSIDDNIKNSILYYPSNRNSCVEENNFHGEIITNAYIPLADMQDSTIKNCCLIIDNANRGMNEQDTKDYINEINKTSQKHNNQVIMFLDINNCQYLIGNNRTYCIENQENISISEKCKTIISNIKN